MSRIREFVKRIMVIILAAGIMAVSIKIFAGTGGLYPGGVAGLSVLIQRSLEMFFHIQIPYTAINVLINLVPIYIGFRFIGRKFTIYSCIMIVLTSVLTDLLPAYVITYDTLLISIFGGILYGAATGFCLLVNTSSGGTDFISIYLFFSNYIKYMFIIIDQLSKN